MIPRLIPFILVFAFACDDIGGKDTDADTDTDTDGDTDTDIDPDWPTGDPDWETTGDISSGEIIDLDFADNSGIYCWPATENMNFTGNHVFHEVTEEEETHMYVRLVPESGVDLSLYAIRFAGAAQYPPDVTSCSSCEAGFDQVNDSNPGKKEEVFLFGHNEYQVVLGVAGANGITSGSYTLMVWDEPKD